MMSKYWYIGRSTWRSHFSTEKPNDNSKSTGQVDGNCILSQMPTRQDDDDNLFHILNTYNNFFFLSLHSFDSIKLLSSAFHSEMLCVCVCVCYVYSLLKSKINHILVSIAFFGSWSVQRYCYLNFSMMCSAQKSKWTRAKENERERERARELFLKEKEDQRQRQRERARA